ncbi:hypothetical protein [Campylobacter sp. US33a]|uniref:hypothetical protein n=1 Tax=Campylobacter sp. US33a TaxID=2498120 RepID=UPI00106740DB|nr:hypothetical protein [Campylobacter sp. US33a]TEY00706.1 hypothetical protein ELQ16_08715 [Campylobacter sp. US33a]
MIQQARSSNSRSFLREAEDCVLILDSVENINYFQSLINNVVAKRKNNETYTGAKEAREQLLALLKRYGEVKTANVWCRNLIVEIDKINELRNILAKKLDEKNIFGVLEIHLQDREINSPHLQFVGIKAEEAETIIAQTVVELGYEISLESAMSKKNFIPYYEENSKARTISLSEQLSFEKQERQIKLIENDGVSFYEQIEIERKKFYELLNTKVGLSKSLIENTRIGKVRKDYDYYKKSTVSLKRDLKQKIENFRNKLR